MTKLFNSRAMLIVFLVICLFTLWYYLTRKKPEPNLQRRFNGESAKLSYDYIVVGSGSAGAILASKLVKGQMKSNSDPPTVLLLEVKKQHNE